jgi:exopolysaccharide biosynthesis protein
MVLSLGPRTIKQLPPLVPGMEIKITTATTPSLAGALMAVGGGPTLVRGGKARSAQELPGYLRRDPRTALGWNDKYYYIVQADGRQPRYSMGMNLVELANYFVKLGCDSAINLDGGGSCTTWVGGKIVNRPSQGRERPSANALVLVRKTKPAN